MSISRFCKSLIGLLAGCFMVNGFGISSNLYGQNNAAPSVYINFDSIQEFTYQLQDIDLAAIGSTGFDLVIIDYSSEGTEDTEYTRIEIESLQNSSGGKKIVVSYMSIGEAEDYRFYWQDQWHTGSPAWLDAENPDWEGNFKVKYWETEWQDIIKTYLDRIIAAGFDGVYMDIIDAYEYYFDQGRTSAPQNMVNFVQVLADHAHTTHPDFLIIPQNGAELAELIPEYVDIVDGIGQEDIYFGYDGDGFATPNDVREELETWLDLFRFRGKFVLTVDYPFSDENVPDFNPITRVKIDEAYTRSKSHGYIPYCTVRELNFLTINPGHEPTGVLLPINLKDNFNAPFIHVYPNPFNAEVMVKTIIPFKSDGIQKIKIDIYNTIGQVVKSFPDQFRVEGNILIKWDGLDDRSDPVQSGVYIFHIRWGSHSLMQRLTLIR